MCAVKGSGTRLARREQAARTRDKILDVAHELFVANGYEATTMQAIADEAGVAVQTVYFRFGTKAHLLADVESRAVLGDAPSDEWRQQPWATQMAAETDPHRLIELFVSVDTDIKGRLSPLVAALGAALPADPSSMADRERGRDEFFGAFVGRLDSLGSLRAGLSPGRAIDILRVIDTLEAYAELTSRRGWSTDDWRTWLTDTLQTQLLGCR